MTMRITIGGDLVVNRLGFGAMRLTGKGISGEPPDRRTAIALLRRVVERSVFDEKSSHLVVADRPVGGDYGEPLHVAEFA